MSATLFADDESCGATISDCGEYRYHLWRIWDYTRPIMVFVMQNPSTADENDDDPTIRRCVGFAKRDGYGGISVRDVFALRATDERELLTHSDPFGPLNFDNLRAARNVSLLTRLVVAWGNRLGGKRLRGHYNTAASACMVQLAYCLGTTKSGDPRHPLFVPGNVEMVRWSMPSY